MFVFVYLAPFPNTPPGPRVLTQCLRGSFYIVILHVYLMLCVFVYAESLLLSTLLTVIGFYRAGIPRLLESLFVIVFVFVFSSPLC